MLKNRFYLTRLSLLLTFREWRSRDIKSIVFTLIIIISLLSGFLWYKDKVELTLVQQASEMTGGDVIIKGRKPIPSSYIEKANSLDFVKSAELVFIPSMIEKQGENQGYVNVDIKAVSSTYPLYGTIQASSIDKQDQELDKAPDPGTVWLEKSIADSLNLSYGDRVELGAITLTYTHTLKKLPNSQADIISMAPALLMNTKDLEAYKLLGTGSKAKYRLFIKGKVGDFIEWVKLNPIPEYKVITSLEERSELLESAKRTLNYIELSIFLVIILSGLLIFSTLEHYAKRKNASIALLRCLGATQKNITYILGVQVLLISLVVGAIGLCLGYIFLTFTNAPFLQTVLGIKSYTLFQPNLLKGLYVLATTAFFFVILSFQHYLYLKKIPPSQVLRSPTDTNIPINWPSRVLLIVFFILAVYGETKKFFLSIFAIFSGVVLLVCLSYLFTLISLLFKKISGFFSATSRLMAMRFGHELKKRRLELTIFSFITFVISLLTITHDTLLYSWQNSDDKKSADNFLINIQSEQLQELNEFLKNRNIPIVYTYPIVRGWLTSHNGTAITLKSFSNALHKNAISRELNLSWIDNLPINNVLVEGKDLKNMEDDKNYISLEEGLATSLSVKIGDTLSFKIEDKPITCQVGNLRRVNWTDFQVNFYIIFSKKTLEKFTKTYILGIKMQTANLLTGL